MALQNKKALFPNLWELCEYVAEVLGVGFKTVREKNNSLYSRGYLRVLGDGRNPGAVGILQGVFHKACNQKKIREAYGDKDCEAFFNRYLRLVSAYHKIFHPHGVRLKSAHIGYFNVEDPCWFYSFMDAAECDMEISVKQLVVSLVSHFLESPSEVYSIIALQTELGQKYGGVCEEAYEKCFSATLFHASDYYALLQKGGSCWDDADDKIAFALPFSGLLNREYCFGIILDNLIKSYKANKARKKRTSSLIDAYAHLGYMLNWMPTGNFDAAKKMPDTLEESAVSLDDILDGEGRQKFEDVAKEIEASESTIKVAKDIAGIKFFGFLLKKTMDSMALLVPPPEEAKRQLETTDFKQMLDSLCVDSPQNNYIWMKLAETFWFLGSTGDVLRDRLKPILEKVSAIFDDEKMKVLLRMLLHYVYKKNEGGLDR